MSPGLTSPLKDFADPLGRPGALFETGLAIAGDPTLPRLATVIAAEVAARRAARLADLDALLGPVLVGSGSPGPRRLLRYLAIAVAIEREDADDASPGIWPAVVERLSENVTVAELPLRIMLDSLVKRGTLLGQELARCGLAARRLLEYLWTVPPTPLIRGGIEAVIATAESDPAATESLLRRALNAGQMTARGYNDLFWLADGVPRLAAIVPGLVEEIYAVAMAYQETSTQRTQLMPGLIQSMTSTRQQDFDGVRSHLVRHYPAYLETSPHSAVAALARLIIGQHGDCPSSTVRLKSFSATIAEDGSRAWDRRDLTDEHDTVSLLNSFEDCLADHTGSPLVTAVFDALAAGPRPAALWRRVLAAGARNHLVADRLCPLDQTLRQCLIKDLEEPLAQLIAARQAERPAEERARLEAVITALAPEDEDNGSLEWARADHRYRLFLQVLDPAGTGNTDSIKSRRN